MIRSLLSLAERLLPRTSSSLLLLMLAWQTGPKIVGIYAWGILIYTFLGAITDSSMRQVIVHAIHSESGGRFVRRYQHLVVLASPMLMTAGLAVLWFLTSVADRHVVASLWPLILAPVIQALNILNIGRLQVAARWATLATGQAFASAVAIGIGVPLVVLLQSPLGSAVGVLTIELVMASYCAFSVRSLRQEEGANKRSISRDFKAMAIYSGLAWTQGQSDRVFVGSIAGSSTLGVLSIGISLARALGDSVAASTSNLLRSELTMAEGEQRKLISQRILLRGMILASLAAAATMAGCAFVIKPILSPEWEAAFEMIPILTLTVVPSVLSWTSAIYHVEYGSRSRSLIAPSVSIVLAFGMGFLALVDLSLLAVGIVIREFILVLVSYSVLGRNAPWISLGHGIAFTACLSMIAYLFASAT